jgi:RNA polymerase sigma factor (sigma-70 family)
MNPHVERLHDELSETARRILRSKCDPNTEQHALDATQHFYMKFFNGDFKNYDPDRDFFPFAGVALRNICIDQYRDRRRHSTERLELDVPEREELSLTPTERDEQRTQVRRAVLALAKPERKVILARYWLQWSTARIAKRLGLSVKTVNPMASRIRRKLRTILGDAFM